MFRLCTLAALIAGVLAATPALAQDIKRIDDEKAKEAAKLLHAAAAKLELPLKVSPDQTKGTGLTAEKSAVFVLADAKLTADAIKKVEKDIVSVGVLFTTANITLLSAEQPIAADKHHTIMIDRKGQTISLNVMTLGVGKVADRLVLLVYTKDKKPAVITELEELEEKTDHTVDVDAKAVGKERAAVMLNILGRYKASIQVGAQPQ